jgi:hypothetical protein
MNGCELRKQSLKIGWLLVWPSGAREAAKSPLLTVCSQTVRIHLDVAAHVGGKDAGQAHNGGHVCTLWDRLVGFKSRHSAPLAPSANRRATHPVARVIA